MTIRGGLAGVAGRYDLGPAPFPGVPHHAALTHPRLLGARETLRVRHDPRLQVRDVDRGILRPRLERLDEKWLALPRVDRRERPLKILIHRGVGIAVPVLAGPAVFRRGEVACREN